MAKVKYDPIKGAAQTLLHQPKIVADIRQRTEAVAAKCNADSSWGGYYSHTYTGGGRPRGRVWSIGRSDRPGGDRALRLLRNLDSGR